MINPYAFNTWLDPLIQNYIAYFGATKHPVVWEVGSRDGKDGVEIARRIYDGNPDWFWTHAQVTCFEPIPEQAALIRKNYPEVEVIQKAASDTNGSAPFVVYHGDEGAVGSSSLNLGWKGDDFGDNKHQIVVETVTLDRLIPEDLQIDVMKIDVEGCTMQVLEGLGDRLRNVRVYHLETEKWTDSNIKAKPLMIGKGYILVDETEQYGGMPDQVWVRA